MVNVDVYHHKALLSIAIKVIKINLIYLITTPSPTYEFQFQANTYILETRFNFQLHGCVRF